MTSDHEVLRDRYRGALLASAAGDALGATVEFLTRDEVGSRFGVLRDIAGGGWLNLKPGEVTDDTQMSCCIAHSIVATGRFDAEDIASRFVAWYRSNPPDIGNTTRHALAQLDAGVPWEEAGWKTHLAMRPRDASNGSVMRAAPVALFARSDAIANKAFSADSSRITHANPLCVASCVALNAAIASLLNDPLQDPVDAAFGATDNSQVRASLSTVGQQTAESLDAGGFVLATLQSALWAVTVHGNLEDAVIAAVNLGDDADTTGAVAGALAGARWGMAQIPARWLDVLDRREELISLADDLLEVSLSRAGG
jgi:ADP-ribosyl-[dinitrogen reductase] hydrolase